MYNLRYHLASLVAVFLALTLGLLLGSVVAERGYLDEQRAALVEGLQADFSELRDTNDALQQDYERDHAFAVQMADTYSAGLLDGRLMLVVGNTGRSDGLGAANSAVVGAGGEVATALFAEAGLGLGTPEARQALAGVATTTSADPDLTSAVIGALAQELRAPAPGQTPVIGALEAVGVLDLEGWDGSRGVDGVIVVASFDNAGDPDIMRLANRLEDAGARALGAEVSWRDEGVVDAALEAGLSAVDHTDLPQGSLSMVMILAGEAEGHYGLRSGASGINPPLGAQAP